MDIPPRKGSATDESAEFSALIEEYKSILKTKQLTYKHIAAKLKLSEAAIKKTLSSDDVSFSRLVDLCRAAGISYFELVRRADRNQERRIELTEKQEEFFTNDLRSFKFFMLLLEQSLENVCKTHKISAEVAANYLDKLAAIGLLERKTGLEYKLLTKGQLLRWSATGPFSRLHNKRISAALVEALYNNFDSPETFRKRASVRMSRETLRELIVRLQAVSDEFASRARREMGTAPAGDMIDVTWVIGVAPFDVWGFLLGDVTL